VFTGRLSSSTGVIGVDFGSCGVKLLQLRESDGRLSVVGAAIVDTPVADPAEMDLERFGEHLQVAVAAAGFTGRRCVVSLARGDVRTQSVRLPPMPETELRQAVGWEAAQRFELERNAMEVDYVRTGASLQSSEGREEVFIVAAPHATLHARLDPVLAAGLRPIAVDADFAALARTFSRQCRRETDQVHVRVVVEVGASGAVAMILRGGLIAFCKPIAIGGDRFNQAVAEHLQLDIESAAELRMARLNAVLGIDAAAEPPDRATHRAVFEAVRPLMDELVQEVVLCIRYFGVTFRGHPPDRIILTGGDGLEPQLDNMLNQACKISVVRDDEVDTIRSLAEPLRAKLSRTTGPPSRWATAAGLSLRGMRQARPRQSAAPRGAAA